MTQLTYAGIGARATPPANGRITCKEARRHGIAPVPRGHPAYPFMRDGDGDGVVESVTQAFIRILTALSGDWPVMFAPTAFDVGGARLAAIDLAEVAPQGSAEADRQSAAFYLLACHALTRHWWIALSATTRSPSFSGSSVSRPCRTGSGRRSGDWAAKSTDAPREVCELALAHMNSDRVEAAYRRTDLFDQRRVLMEEWSGFVGERGESGKNHDRR